METRKSVVNVKRMSMQGGLDVKKIGLATSANALMSVENLEDQQQNN